MEKKKTKTKQSKFCRHTFFAPVNRLFFRLFFCCCSQAEDVLFWWREATTENITGFGGYRKINCVFYDSNTQIVTFAYLY